ncbi:MAG: DoxX family protein [Sulfobacillus sp.]
MSTDTPGRERGAKGLEVGSDGSLRLPTTQHLLTEVAEPALSRLLFGDTRLAWFWLLVRLYVGWQWVFAGWEKLLSPAWVGVKAGTGLTGFLQGSLSQMTGAHPNVQGWYGAFLQGVVVPHAAVFSYIVTGGELAVGLALILGVLTGVAAFFGCFMNMNYLLAGAVSINPVLFLLSLFLVLSWRIAGWYGADHWILPQLGTPWQPGPISRHNHRRTVAQAAH